VPKPGAAEEIVTVRPRPEKRKNAKEKFSKKSAEGGTTPDTTAKAKSKAETSKSEKSKPEKAERKEKAKKKAK
jgi:hypothetical protein